MSGYESDSSDEGEYTETNVLLGFAGKEPGDDAISKIGGTPDWLTPSSPPTHSLTKCLSCSSPTVQLLQLNAELPDHFPHHTRRLWVFMCQAKKCRRREGCMRAVRGVKVDRRAVEEERRQREEEEEDRERERRRKEDEEKKEKEKGASPFAGGGGGKGGGMGEFLFGVSGFKGRSMDPAATTTTTTANKTTTTTTTATAIATATDEREASKPIDQQQQLTNSFTQALKLNLPSPPTSPSPSPAPAYEEWPQTLPTPYPTLYLADAEYETLDHTPTLVPAHATTDMDIDAVGGLGGSGGAGGGGKNGNNGGAGAGGAEGGSGLGGDKEKAFESLMDSSFQRFADRIAQNPEQAIRYEFGGTPLLYNKDDAVGRMLVPPCEEAGPSAVTVVGRGRGGGTGRIPPCPNCGASRVFEVQLVPGLIADLEGEKVDLEGMDWGSVFVGVCSADCTSTTSRAAGGRTGGGIQKDEDEYYVSEWVGVQWEDLGK